jgi:predicted CXXCH cytochrome family protein
VCHVATKPALVAKHPGIDLAKVNCQSCHDPHVQKKGEHALMLPAKHLPFMRGDCTGCHIEKGKPALKKTGADLCVSCHPQGGWVGRKNVHPPLASGAQCLNCHGAHGGEGTPNLKRPESELCFDCHRREAFQGKFVHQALEQGCTACHDPHGSNGPKLINAATIEDVCRTCHADLSKHFHKTSSDRLDPSGRPLTCTSCHRPHAADEEGLLIAEPKRELCIRCHDPNMAPGERPPSPSPQPAPTGKPGDTGKPGGNGKPN